MDISAPLLAWYDAHRRDLPWRRTRDPYRILVSEIMLQQTRAAAVIPYYARFLEALPDVNALAACPDDALMKLWEGLGYYSRARNLKKCAGTLVSQYGGRFPETAEALRALPGIGPYTAGAVASIAFGKPEPAVDGNVLRILARVRAHEGNVLDASVQRDHRAFLLTQDLSRAGDLNQAFMDLGSLVCLPKAPLCGGCPLRAQCLARLAGSEGRLPLRLKKQERKVQQLTVFCVKTDAGLLLRRREKTGLLAGLWEFPNVEGFYPPEEALRLLPLPRPKGGVMTYTRKHVFTHILWEMQVVCYEAAAEELPEGCFLGTGSEALPTAFLKCLPDYRK